MAIVLFEGFEHNTHVGNNYGGGGSRFLGWQSTSGNFVISTFNPRPLTRSGQPAGAGRIRSTNAASSVRMFRGFPRNNDTGQRLHLREVTVGFGLITGNSTNLPGTLGHVSVGPHLSTQRFGLYIQQNRSHFMRDGSTLLSEFDDFPPGVWGSYWFSVFIDLVDGWARAYREEDVENPFLSFDGATMAGTANWASFVGIGTAGNNWHDAYDDLVVLAPSLMLAGATPVAEREELITGSISGATARVSDYEPSKGRVWLHQWNQIPWVDGESVTGSINGVLGSVHAPTNHYVHGFEPFSFPRPLDQGGLPAVIVTAPQTTVSAQLAPVGSGDNVQNVNSIPYTLSGRNEATSGDKSDTYTDNPIPSWVRGVHAVQQEIMAQGEGEYFSYTTTTTDTTGSQSAQDEAQEIIIRTPVVLPTKADGTPWTPEDIPTIQTTVTMEES